MNSHYRIAHNCRSGHWRTTCATANACFVPRKQYLDHCSLMSTGRQTFLWSTDNGGATENWTPVSSVTGWRDRPLHYSTILIYFGGGSGCRPQPPVSWPKSLANSPLRHRWVSLHIYFGGRAEIWTPTKRATIFRATITLLTPYVVARVGVEPTTSGFSDQRSYHNWAT